ncbi:PH domain-containing protein [Amycolatopsis acidicola]|uniref:PH domain-containing protein n=1 Tax=Amycolatopsis acidicola TaxID=2596893 RepID=A0A5N0V1I8_9PSEU|nr:PH domain-containing protein [Amycolatopsis acidicola]KAA9159475.1 PH domain-containing protein [Amycolatopsis acidicola]
MAETEQLRKRRKAVFRIPLIALLAIFGAMVCMAPAAFADVPGLWAMYVIPLGLIVFVIRTRTVATPEGLAIRTMFGHRELPWDALKGFSITKRAKVRAVLSDDSTIALPTVRARHLPVLSLVSNGRVKDPTGLVDDLNEQQAGQAEEKPAEEKPAEEPEKSEQQ